MKIKDKINPDQIKEAERLDFIFRSNQEFAKGFRAQIRRIEYDLAYFQKNEQQVNKLLDLKKEYEFFLENLHRENLLIAENLAANPAAIYLPGMLGPMEWTDAEGNRCRVVVSEKKSWLKKIFRK